MADYLRSEELSSFRIFIIEQSDDGRKFNRGKLLNIGAKIAEDEGFDVFIFHDVDLLPSESIKSWYLKQPGDREIFHIAQCWNRYNQNKSYLGGIVSFSSRTFRDIDG
jgi:hypothetical protein